MVALTYLNCIAGGGTTYGTISNSKKVRVLSKQNFFVFIYFLILHLVQV